MRTISVVSLMMVTGLAASGCGTDNPFDNPPEPTEPKLAGIIANPITVAPGDTSRITVQVADADIDTLSISFVATGGVISGAGAEAIFVAGQSETVATISVTLSGSLGPIASGAATINVTNNPPLISVASQQLNEQDTGNQCLVFIGLPSEELTLFALDLVNPAGVEIGLTGGLVTQITGRNLPAGTPFALQTAGRCFTLLSGEYTFTFTIQDASSETSTEFVATFVQP